MIKALLGMYKYEHGHLRGSPINMDMLSSRTTRKPWYVDYIPEYTTISTLYGYSVQTNELIRSAIGLTRV